MKNFIKKLLYAFLALIIVITIAVLSVKAVRYGSKMKTFQYVKNNSQQLTAEAEAIIENGVYAHYQYDSLTVTYYPTARCPIVEFSTGGFGIAPSGYYTGFYYSQEDIPVRYNGNGTNMEQAQNGWSYQDRGDNHGYTEKICDNWYWYKFCF